MKLLLYLVASLLLLVVTTKAQGDGGTTDVCLDGTYAVEFSTCGDANACTCDNCDELEPNFQTAFAANGNQILTCAQTEAEYCPWVRCCSACWESRETFVQCSSVNLLVGTFVEADCMIDCSSYPFKDEPIAGCDGGAVDSPTPVPVTVPTPVGMVTPTDAPVVQAAPADTITEPPTETSICTNEEFAIDFTSCLIEHACTCGNCDDEEPDIQGMVDGSGGTALTCAQVEEAYCPWIRCCSACWESRQTWVQCTSVQVFSSLATIEPGCELDCESYPATDEVSSDCVDGCGNEWGTYVSCAIDNCSDQTTSECSNDQQDEQANLFLAATLWNSCNAVNEAVCHSAQDSCCPECTGSLGTYVQCILDSGEVVGSPLSGCNVACADGGTNRPPGGSQGNGGGSGAVPSVQLGLFVVVMALAAVHEMIW